MAEPAQPAFRNILVATDFSDTSVAVLQYAAAVAKDHGATLTVVHVVPLEEYQFGPPDRLQTLRGDAEATMARFISTHSAAEPPPRTEVLHGEVAHMVEDAIRRGGHDLLLLGTAGRRGLKRFFMGSVAEEIFRSISIPAITLGPNALGRAAGTLRQVLVATDFSPDSCAALPWAAKLAQRSQADVALVHVVPASLGEDTETVTRTYRERLRELVPPGMAAPPELLVKFGDADDQILAAAKERAADLIVIGIRGGGGFDRARTHLLGPTTASVIAQAACPVLTVRAGG